MVTNWLQQVVRQGLPGGLPHVPPPPVGEGLPPQASCLELLSCAITSRLKRWWQHLILLPGTQRSKLLGQP